MAAKLFGSISSWPQRWVDFNVKTQGLGDSPLLRKYVPIIHRAMLIPVIVAVVQQMGFVFELLNRDHFTIDEIVYRLVYAAYFGTDLVYVYLFGFRHSRTAECMRNVTPKLHCYSGRDLPFFKYFILIVGMSLYSNAIGLTIVSPLIRFNLTKRKATFVVLPNWYPVDVLSTPSRIWAAWVHESVVVWYGAHNSAITGAMFYYGMMVAKVRFDALARYFENISSGVDQAVSVSVSAEARCSSKDTSLSDDRAALAGRVALRGTWRYLKPNSVIQAAGTYENQKLNMLKKGMEDWAVLRRQVRMVCDAFSAFPSLTHCAVLYSIVISCFAIIKISQNSHNETGDVIVMYSESLTIICTCLTHLFALSYSATAVEESHNNLRTSLWRSRWLTEDLQFKKLFHHCEVALSQPLKMKVYSFHPLNLYTLTKDLFRAWSFLSFLRQMSTPE